VASWRLAETAVIDPRIALFEGAVNRQYAAQNPPAAAPHMPTIDGPSFPGSTRALWRPNTLPSGFTPSDVIWIADRPTLTTRHSMRSPAACRKIDVEAVAPQAEPAANQIESAAARIEP